MRAADRERPCLTAQMQLQLAVFAPLDALNGAGVDHGAAMDLLE